MVLPAWVVKPPVPSNAAVVPVTSNAPTTVTLPVPASAPPLMVRLVKVVSTATSSVPAAMVVRPV